MAFRFIVSGRQIESRASGADSAVRGELVLPNAEPSLLDCVVVERTIELFEATRDRADETLEFDVDDDCLLEFEFEGGLRQWLTPQRYRELLKRHDPAAVSEDVTLIRSVSGTTLTNRSIIGGFRAILRVVRRIADPLVQLWENVKNWPQDLKDAAFEWGAVATTWGLAKAITYFLEQQLKPGPGLFHWRMVNGEPLQDFGDARRLDPQLLNHNLPVLLFIHGTASSTIGSFGALAASEARQEWRQLTEKFGPNIVAFEHRSLSESPIENAIALAKELPPNIDLHLVSHSRGGLVGDLLSLQDIHDEAIEQYGRGGEFDEVDRTDRKKLHELKQLLAQKQFKVHRFARVACPASGTSLASKNIEAFVALIVHGMRMATGDSPLVAFASRVAIEIAKSRLNARWIPGIEAMTPESPLVALLNRDAGHRPESKGELGIVAGDSKDLAGLIEQLIGVWDERVFGSQPNDWVVDTTSMFDGAIRNEKPVYLFDQRDDVNHFRYFRNSRTRRPLVNWICSDQASRIQEFSPVPSRVAVESLAVTPRGSRGGPDAEIPSDGEKPILFVLPGIMGSELSENQVKLWFDTFKVFNGRLRDALDLDNQQIVASGLYKSSYTDLIAHFSDSHTVIPFAYDWRMSTAASAKRLAEQVKGEFERTTAKAVPIRFIAHSMGGLVVRRMIADFPGLWDNVCARDGSRLLFLGTPNRGAHSTIETLLARDFKIRALAALDRKHSTSEILEMIGKLPGALELLPHSSGWFDEGVWQKLKTANDGQGAIPANDLLKIVSSAIEKLPVQLPHADRIKYVAGSGIETAEEVSVENSRVVVKTTMLGDGTVTHDSGRLPGVDTWFVEHKHGDLPTARRKFAGYQDLLEKGDTARFQRTPIGDRGGEPGRRLDAMPMLFPSESRIDEYLFDRSPATLEPVFSSSLKVRVVHGDLAYARHPVMVGHYEGDTITRAEAHLDRKLDGALTMRDGLGLYPAQIGASHVVLGERNVARTGVPCGAIVVGLGRMGELGAGSLANAVRTGTLDYVTLLKGRMGREEIESATTQTIGVSVLLIGTASAANLTIEDSIGAILRGIAVANRELERLRTGLRIDEVEIIEVFGDQATNALRVVKKLKPLLESELHARFEIEPTLDERLGRRTRITARHDNGDWRRWTITAKPNDGLGACIKQLPEPIRYQAWEAWLKQAVGDRKTADSLYEALCGGRGGTQGPQKLTYVAMSPTARAEIEEVQKQPGLVEEMLSTALERGQVRLERLRAIAHLLVPNDLKENLNQLTRLVLVLDEFTANYPWEMLVIGSDPLCVQSALIRQLATSSSRFHIRASTSHAALVVGSPRVDPPWKELSGAKEEAHRVALKLRKHFDVYELADSPDATAVFDELLTRPYRLLHLAGHGIYRTGGERSDSQYGMLLNKGRILTAAEIGQLPQIPEFVFLNCCHLGGIGASVPAEARVEFNKLAASISRELIDMGVRAVIAAGWAVRDDLARRFSDSFYGRFLDGASFGEAVHHARRDVYAEQPQSNTWGAYQAYGDPDYRITGFSRRDDEVRSLSDELVSPTELIDALRGVVDSIKGGSQQQQVVDAARQSVETLRASGDPSWHDRPDVLAAFGRTYSELGDLSKAIWYYERAVSADDGEDEVNLEGKVQIKVIEQLANMEVRHGAKTGDEELVEKGIKRLSSLIGLVGATSERLGLLGSAHKRLARVLAKKIAGEPLSVEDREQLSGRLRSVLVESAKSYQVAADRCKNAVKPDYYQRTNAVAIQLVLGNESHDAVTELQRCSAQAVDASKRTNHVWSALGAIDADILLAVIEGSLVGDKVDKFFGEFKDVRKRFNVTRREFGSAVDQLSFLLEMSSLFPDSVVGRSTTELRKLKQRVENEA